MHQNMEIKLFEVAAFKYAFIVSFSLLQVTVYLCVCDLSSYTSLETI